TPACSATASNVRSRRFHGSNLCTRYRRRLPIDGSPIIMNCLVAWRRTFLTAGNLAQFSSGKERSRARGRCSVASPGDLMAAAVERTGLGDFGDDSFLEGLEILARAVATEARLNARGEGFVYQRIGLHLAQRLQVEDWYRRHPEIDDVILEPPLFGMGLPRTGSTALSFLLAQDPSVRYMRSWEAAQPCPPPSTVHGDDPRIPVDEQKVVAGSRHHVPQDAHGPMECLDLMALDFKSQIFQAYAQIPSYSAWLVDRADFTSTYRYERRVLKLLQWGEPVRPWRLKSPAHVLSLDYLDRVFPDAKFVM